MRVGWQFEKLGDVCSFINRGISPKYLDQGGVCVLNQKCIRDHRINYALARRHDLTAKKVVADRFIQLGDVLVNSTGTGTLGRVAQVREEPAEATTVDSHVTIVRPVPGKFFQDFFGYMLVFIEEALKEAGEGCGGQTELARSVLTEKFSVAYPSSHAEQQRIVAILDEAFAGIATARAHAEQNLQNARALFESQLQAVFSQRGEGWSEMPLCEVSSILNGYAFKSGDFSPNGPTRSIKITNVGVREFVETSDSGLPEDFSKQFASVAVSAGSLVVALTRTIIADGLKVAIVPPSYDRALVNQRVAALLPKPELVSASYLFAYLSTSIVLNYVKERVNTLMQPNLSINDLRAMPIPLPPSSQREKIVDGLLALESETQRLESLYQRKLDALDELKQSLLHQAFSGNL